MIFLFIQLVLTLIFLRASISLNPLLIRFLVVILSFVTSLSLLLFFSQWFMLALILLYIGGIIILFFYMVSLAHEKKSVLIFNIGGGAVFALALLLSWQGRDQSPSYASSLYFLISFGAILFVIIYLLISLVLVRKLLKQFKCSLKIIFHD